MRWTIGVRELVTDKVIEYWLEKQAGQGCSMRVSRMMDDGLTRGIDLGQHVGKPEAPLNPGHF